MKRVLLSPLFFFLALLFFTHTPIHSAHAQLIPGGSSFDVEISPQYPTPYSVVTISPSSSLIDLSASTISVSVNGRLVGQGSGTEPTQIQVGGAGEKTTVVVTVLTNGKKVSKTLTIRPAEVSLIEEAVSPTHPFYEGIGVVGSEGTVRLVAVADLRTSANVRIPASSLVYNWKLDNQQLTNSSGIGKSVLVATAPPRYRTAPITLTVSTQDNSIVSQAKIIINPVDPIVRMYQTDPLLGPLFNRALSGTFTLNNSEASFRAVPYNFSGNIGFVWKVNGTQGGTSNDITVRSQGNGVGRAELSVSTNNNDLYQSAASSLSVLFGANKPFGIFGL